MFDDWFSALKAGYLDDRSWIFDKETVTKIINTLKSVRRRNTPAEGIIDLESWTITDLYHFHPRGKDVSFWKEFLVEINARLQLKPEKARARDLCRHISAVLDGGY